MATARPPKNNVHRVLLWWDYLAVPVLVYSGTTALEILLEVPKLHFSSNTGENYLSALFYLESIMKLPDLSLIEHACVLPLYPPART